MASPVPDDNKVTYHFLGRSGLKVANLCLGTMTFGESAWGLPRQMNEEQSHLMIKRYTEWGGNFLDTADAYGLGKSETIVGKWLETLAQRRQQLSTDPATLDQPDVSDFANPNQVIECAKSLLHRGTVVKNQQYNLLTRESEFEAFQVCKNQGLGVLAWSPLKWGLLTGKLNRGDEPTEGRAAFAPKSFPFMSDLSDRTFDIVDTVKDIAKKRGRTVPQVAIRWLLQKDVVTSVIIGARTLEQIDDNMAAANGWRLTKQEMQRLDDVSASKLIYPYVMVFGMNQDRQNPTTSNFYINSTS